MVGRRQSRWFPHLGRWLCCERERESRYSVVSALKKATRIPSSAITGGRRGLLRGHLASTWNGVGAFFFGGLYIIGPPALEGVVAHGPPMASWVETGPRLTLP